MPGSINGEGAPTWVERLADVTRAFPYATSQEAVLELTARRAADLLRADRAVLLVADEEGQLRIRAAHGVDRSVAELFREPVDERLVSRLREILGEGAESRFLGVPLIAGGEVIGLLATLCPADAPVEATEWLLSWLADQAAMAMDAVRPDREARARLEGRVQQAEGAMRARERALSVLAHDLRTPLSTIRVLVELILEQRWGPLSEKQREMLSRVRRAERHVAAVLDRVLEMQRMEAGAVTIQTYAVRPSEVMREAVELLQHRTADGGQTLEVETGDDPLVRADRDHLRQVLLNLLSNALDYTPADGWIRLVATVEHAGGRTWGAIAVADSGSGIAADELDLVFEPFYRGTKTRTAPRGAGLGLTISRELVRLMGGRLVVRSEPGLGSTFTVLLQRVGEDEGS